MTRVLAVAFALSASFLAPGEDVTTLERGQTIERQISADGRDTYRIALEAAQYAAVVVEQRGMDVSLELTDPAGNSIALVQDEITTSGDERLQIVADTAGAYTLTVSAAVPHAPPGEYGICLIETRAATANDRSEDEITRLRTQAARMNEQGKGAEARPLLERASALAEDLHGPDDLTVAFIARDLGGIYLDQRDHAKAESQFQLAIPILEKILGSEHPATAFALSRLGVVYDRTGQRAKAEKLLQDALDVTERALGPDHPQVARCLVSLANLREHAGDDDKAEELERRAIAITERAGLTESILFANLLNNLGMVYLNRDDYDRADELFRRSLPIGERLLGPDSYWVANSLQNLGIIARQRRDYGTAEEYDRRALEIRLKTVGPDHPDIASNLTNLGNVYASKGDYARAIETHGRALQIWEQTSGPYGGGTLTALGNLARAYSSIGDIPKALAYQHRVDAAVENQLAMNLAIGSERQKLAFAESLADRTDRTISFSVNLAPANPDAAALAALVLLQRKGRVLDAMTDTLATLREHTADADDRELLGELAEVTSQLARLALNGPRGTPLGQHQQELKTLSDRKERLEAQISEHSAEFRAASRAVTIEGVQTALPPDAALIEFVVFRPFNPGAATSAESFGEAHYAAYVIAPRTTPRGRDLGPAGKIDEAIHALREALRDPTRHDVVGLARAADERVMRPVRALLPTVSRLLISPDGQLNLLPFEALRDERGRYAIDRYAITYLTSGRDLLRLQVPRESRSTALVIADPSFGEPAVTPARATRQTAGGNDLSTVYFTPLRGTTEEARAIQSLFPEATVLTGVRATKAALAQAEAPRMLHIASHGFFLTDPSAAGDGPVGETRSISASARVENPLLRSGLALAGANLNKSTTDGGILTALEAANLNLWGTELVTLSACDTGVGVVRNGEGVYGLRRAFFLAGAETLVMSLWPVSDYVTREMMTAYYTGLKRGLGRGEALRAAQRAMRARPNRQHPFYWAGFIQAGDWRPLDAEPPAASR